MNSSKSIRTSVLAASLALAAYTAPIAAQTHDAAERELEQRAVGVLPHPRQVAWQEMEFTAFVHFGVNTFTGREWGTGKEDEKIFNPAKLDANQWVAALKAAGVRGVIATAKHHDGFCLWPSRFTPHTVKNSNWRNGQGDVVRELATACRKAGLKLGVYLSPADLNAMEHGVYGKTAAKPRVIPTPVDGWKPKSDFRMEGNWDDYNTYFMNQLFELLTEYGDIFEVWFDGANPKPGTGQVYAYQDWYALIRKLQPNAVIFGKGPDVRWVGNEAGGSRSAEWSVVPIPVPAEQFDWNDMTARDLGSRDRVRSAKYLVWYPAETDVSIRPGWFWHAQEDARVHSLDKLLDIHHRAAGGNSLLLLNVPPNTNGLFAAADVQRLRELGDVLRATFKDNLAKGGKVTASATRGPEFAAAKVLDGNPRTAWMPADWTATAELEIKLPAQRRFNLAMMKEDIARSGQRVERFALDVGDGAGWREIATAETIGCQRLLQFSPVETDRVRVRFLAARVCPTLAELGLFFEPPRLAAPTIRRDKTGQVTLAAGDGVKIHFTLDGSDPTPRSPVYAEPIPLTKGGVVKALAVALKGGEKFIKVGEPTATAVFGVSKAKWRVVSCSSEETPGEAAANAIDDNPQTVWHTRYKTEAPRHPHEIVVDLGESLRLTGFTYLPRASGVITKDYAFFTSADGQTWGAAAAQGEFGNIRNNPVLQTVPFPAREARFIKFVSKSEVEGKPWTCVAELGVVAE
jgi:alpha-L-fucosidase